MSINTWPVGLDIDWRVMHFLRPKDWQLNHDGKNLANIGAKRRFSRFFEADYDGHFISIEYRRKENSAVIVDLNRKKEIGVISNLFHSDETLIILSDGNKFSIHNEKHKWAFTDEKGTILATTAFNNMNTPLESKFTLLEHPDKLGIHPGLIAVLSQYYSLQQGLGY